MSPNLVALLYLASGVLFILALRGLSITTALWNNENVRGQISHLPLNRQETRPAAQERSTNQLQGDAQ